MSRRRRTLMLLSGAVARRALATLVACTAASCALAAEPSPSIERVKASVVAVGTYMPTRVPPFKFLGTGFAAAGGSVIVTNAHVTAGVPEPAAGTERLVVLLPGRHDAPVNFRDAARITTDAVHDIALLRIGGPALPPLAVSERDTVAEGDELLFTGFPIGGVIGLVPVTHRAMVGSITPVAIPPLHSSQLDAKAIHRLRSGMFPMYQLDATAYPGNSGSPLYDRATGEVVGIVNMGLARSTRESLLSKPSGITYAVPSSHIAELLRATAR